MQKPTFITSKDKVYRSTTEGENELNSENSDFSVAIKYVYVSIEGNTVEKAFNIFAKAETAREAYRKAEETMRNRYGRSVNFAILSVIDLREPANK